MSAHDASIRLARQLGEIAADQKSRAAMVHGPRREMHLADAKTCEDAAALLQKLDTEVYRLREGIGCHFYGRISGPELARMASTWNGDAMSSQKSNGGRAMTMGLPCDNQGYDLRTEPCRQCGSRGCPKMNKCKDKDERFPPGWIRASARSQRAAEDKGLTPIERVRLELHLSYEYSQAPEFDPDDVESLLKVHDALSAADGAEK